MKLPAIARMVGVHRGTIRNWIKIGLVIPISGGGERGCDYVLDQDEIAKMQEIVKMRRLRIPLMEIRDLVKILSADDVGKFLRSNEARINTEHRKIVVKTKHAKRKEVPRLKGQQFDCEKAAIRAFERVIISIRRIMATCRFSEQNQATVREMAAGLAAATAQEV